MPLPRTLAHLEEYVEEIIGCRWDRNYVLVFFHDQRDEYERPCEIWPRTQARESKANGKGQFIHGGAAFRLSTTKTAAQKAVGYWGGASKSPMSDPAINAREVLANAGITPLIVDFSGDPVTVPDMRLVKRAREKVRNYNAEDCCDGRAPLLRRHSTAQPPNLTRPKR